MKPYWVGYGTLGGRQPFVEMDARFEFFFVGGGGVGVGSTLYFMDKY